VPLEDSSGNRRRLGHITKQGNALLRFLLGPRTALAFVLIIGKADRFPCGQQIASYLGLVEAAQVTARSLPEWRSHYVHLTMRRGRKIAKVAMARKLAVRLYWRMRKEWDLGKLTKFDAGKPGTGDGVK